MIDQLSDHEPPTPYLQRAPASFKPFRFAAIFILLIFLLIALALFSR